MPDVTNKTSDSLDDAPPLLMPSATDDFLFGTPDLRRKIVRAAFTKYVLQCSVLRLRSDCAEALAAGRDVEFDAGADADIVVHGFMADFGEYFSFGVAERDPDYGLGSHNKFPEWWSNIVHDALFD